MSKMKTGFNLNYNKARNNGRAFIEIWPESKDNSQVLLRVVVGFETAHLYEKDLETFAINILKALRSKKLKV